MAMAPQGFFTSLACPRVSHHARREAKRCYVTIRRPPAPAPSLAHRAPTFAFTRYLMMTMIMFSN